MNRKYEVTLYYTGSSRYEVYASDEKDAAQKALNLSANRSTASEIEIDRKCDAYSADLI